MTRTAATTSFSAGGEWLSNLVVIGIHNQSVVNLLAGGFNGPAVVQAWTLTLQVHLPGGIGLHCDSSLDGNGRVRYTAFASGIALAGAEYPVAQGPAVHLDRYVIRGIVEDEGGVPIAGIAVRIHDEMLYTDSAGAFFIRLKKSGEYEVSILPEQALNRGNWEAVTEPIAGRTDTKDPLLIVLRRRR